MSKTEKTDYPLIQRSVNITPAARKQLSGQVSEESQVIVHCSFFHPFLKGDIRIRKSTFLIPREFKHQSKLIHVENITLYPEWTPFIAGEKIVFTLIFSKLPKRCHIFDMVEVCPEPGGFQVLDISRNQSDVYHLKVT